MTARSALRAIAVLGGLALVVVLWRYWATLCNEACAPGRALSMQWLSLALPASVVFAVFAVSARRPSRVRCLVAGGLLAVLLLWGVCVSWIP